MKALVGAFNQEKALIVGAFSVIVKLKAEGADAECVLVWRVMYGGDGALE